MTNSTDGTVTRIDPSSGRAGKALPAIVGASGIAFGHGRLWVVSPATGKVAALDPRGRRVVKEIGVGTEPAAVAAGGGAVWVANRADNTVSKIDPGTLSVTDIVPVGRGPAAVAASDEAVWVANGEDGTVSRFDARGNSEAESTTLENPPRGLALTPAGIYVAVGSRGTEHRGGELKVVTGALDSVDPALANQEDSWGLLTVTNDGLVGFRRVGGVQGVQLVPDLAVSLPAPTNGGTTYTFQVPPGESATRTEGSYSPRTSATPWSACSSSARRVRRTTQGSSGPIACKKGKPCDLSRGVVTDRASRTVGVHLSEPDGDLLTKLALPSAYAVPAGTPRRVTAANPVPATGPYRIAGYDEKTKTYRLVRNARFRQWSADAQPDGFPDVITLNERGFFQSARIRAVRRGLGDITVAGGPPISKEEVDQLFARYPSRLRLNTAFNTEFFFLNTRVAPFDNLQVRRAVNHAFDSATSCRAAGSCVCPDVPNPPTELPGLPAHVPVRNRRRRSPRAVRGSWSRAQALPARRSPCGCRSRAPTVRATSPPCSSCSTSAQMSGSCPSIPPTAGSAPTSTRSATPAMECRPATAGGSPTTRPLPPLSRPSSAVQHSSLRARSTRISRSSAIRASTRRWLARPRSRHRILRRRRFCGSEVERDLLAQAPLLPTYIRPNVDFLSKRVGNYQYNPQWGPCSASSGWISRRCRLASSTVDHEVVGVQPRARSSGPWHLQSEITPRCPSVLFLDRLRTTPPSLNS